MAPETVRNLILARVKDLGFQLEHLRNSHAAYLAAEAELDSLNKWLVDDFNGKTA